MKKRFAKLRQLEKYIRKTLLAQKFQVKNSGASKSTTAKLGWPAKNATAKLKWLEKCNCAILMARDMRLQNSGDARSATAKPGWSKRVRFPWTARKAQLRNSGGLRGATTKLGLSKRVSFRGRLEKCNFPIQASRKMHLQNSATHIECKEIFFVHSSSIHF